MADYDKEIRGRTTGYRSSDGGGIAPGKLSNGKGIRPVHYRPINFNTQTLRDSSHVGLSVLGGRMTPEFMRECEFIETMYNVALEKRDYAKIRDLLKAVCVYVGYLNDCRRKPQDVPPIVMDNLSNLKKKSKDLESKIKKTLREAGISSFSI